MNSPADLAGPRPSGLTGPRDWPGDIRIAMTATTRSLPARARVWLGWTLAVATVVLCGAGSNFGKLASPYLPAREGATQHYFTLTPIVAIAFGVVGALIVWRRPRNRIG